MQREVSQGQYRACEPANSRYPQPLPQSFLTVSRAPHPPPPPGPLAEPKLEARFLGVGAGKGEHILLGYIGEWLGVGERCEGGRIMGLLNQGLAFKL